MIVISDIRLCMLLFTLVFFVTRNMLCHMTDKYMNKTAQLCVNTLYSTVCSVLSLYYLYTYEYLVIHYVQHWSIAYFVYDIYWHLKNQNLLFTCHNIVSILVFIYLLPTSVTDLDGNLMILGIWSGEISNFVVYHVDYKICIKLPLTNFDFVVKAFAFLVWRNLVGLLMMTLLTNHIYLLYVIYFWSVSIWCGIGVLRQLCHKIIHDIEMERFNY